MDLLLEVSSSLLDGDEERVADFTGRALEAGLSPKEILDEGLLAGMAIVSERFKAHEIFLPEVLMAAKAMYAGMDKIKPLLAEQGVASRGKIVLGSVRGDLHDIGKNLVGVMLKGAGFEIIDLGNDVAPERFVSAAQEEGAPVIGMSALLTTTMAAMEGVVNLIEQEGLAGKIKTIVGGAPVSQEFADKIGADAHGFDAASAVDRVNALISED